MTICYLNIGYYYIVIKGLRVRGIMVDAVKINCAYCDMYAFLGNELPNMLPWRYDSWT
jgi:hypothetical protein